MTGVLGAATMSETENSQIELAKEHWRTLESERSSVWNAAEYGVIALRSAQLMNVGIFAAIVALAGKMNLSDPVVITNIKYALFLNGGGLFLSTLASGAAYMSQVSNGLSYRSKEKIDSYPYVIDKNLEESRKFRRRGVNFQVASIFLVLVSYLTFAVTLIFFAPGMISGSG